MNRKIYFYSLFFSSFLLILGAFLKINHISAANLFLTMGTLLALVYVFIALENIYKSNITIFEKILWLFFFILLPAVAGIVYHIYNSKQIENKN